ncbi:MAG: NAD(P)-dependent oxidoreductase [Rhizobiaceae bacterium]
MSETYGVFGLGLIGIAVAGRLLGKGEKVVGFDPAPERMKLLGEAGGEPVDVDAVWSRAQTIIVAVFDTDQLAALIEDARDLEESKLVVLSTCDPDRMAAIAELAVARNIELVEAPLSGTSQQLARGDAVFLTGGNSETVARLDPLFSMLGKAHHYVGKIGNGNRTKLAINLILGLNRAALAEGLVFAERLGLEPENFLKLAQGSAASSAVMDTKGRLMVSRNFKAQGRISQSLKDFLLILQAAESKQQNLPFAQTYMSMMEDCVVNGEEDLDNSAIINALVRARITV